MSSLLFFCKNSKAITVHMLACKKRIIDAELFGQKDFLMNWEVVGTYGGCDCKQYTQKRKT